MVGELIGHYRILSQLGSGGMGVVYLADDLSLNRRVALKFIRADGVRTADADARLIREARAASALDHPNVATIYEIGEWQGGHFIAMAWYDGETLAQRIARGSLPIDEAVRLLIQIADGLARAHAAGIVHRDLKPGNIIVTRDGVAKILDFGLAVYSTPDAATEARLTATGSTLGTVAYMSPEQAVGGRLDARADVWALGVIAYEVLSGQLPFRGPHAAAQLHAIQYDEPADLKAARPDVPEVIRAPVMTALKRRPAERVQSAAEIAEALRAWRASAVPQAAGQTARRGLLRRPMVVASAILVLVVASVFAGLALARQGRARWARDVALPEASRLADEERMVEAFDLFVRAEAALPDSPLVAQLAETVARTLPIRSDPPGATVSYQDYQHPDGPWRPAGVTPIERARVPAAYLRWRFEKTGYTTVEFPRMTLTLGSFRESTTIDGVLTPTDAAPPGMVFVPATSEPARIFLPGLDHLAALGTIGAYWIDRHEVTNADFRKFVEAGGYRRPELWQEPFIDHGRTLPWADAIKRFVDSTGRPGPSTWIQAEPPAGEGALPVTGVSWYEAVAYARFAGKHLPTIHHWSLAAEPRAARWVIPFANFGGRGPLAGAGRHALHWAGTFDMAGNVKEWVSTDSGDGRRYILGGAFDDPVYTFNDPDARAPFDRVRTFGFRCLTYADTPAGTLMAAVPWPTRDYSREKPVSDQVFEIYRRNFVYDREPLDPRVLGTVDRGTGWRREDVAIRAAYGGEEMRVFLFLPKHTSPPFETVVVIPSSNALRTRSIDQYPLTNIEFLVKSGRAVVLPEFKGTFGRPTAIQDSTANGTALYRDHVIAWVRDFGRAVDYLATRADFSLTRLAFVGSSWGGRMGAIIPAIDRRVTAQVLVVGGFSLQRPQPEVDQINFASRIAIPTLMLNGRYDFFFPIETSQVPMFQAFSTPKEHKRHQLYDGGHNIPRVELIKETLAWLDRYQPLTGSPPK